MNSIIKRGPVVIMLVKTESCPYCISYMPLWKKLCKTAGRKTNMISMDASAYKKTEFAQKKPVSGVPTVLYVNKAGEITEAREPRNMDMMTKAVKMLPGSDLPSSSGSSGPSGSSDSYGSSGSSGYSGSYGSSRSGSGSSYSSESLPIPGTRTSENPLRAIPASVVQSGGSPWAAFLLAAKQAAPAAVLLGAYAALPAKRASGLSAPRTRRRRRR